MLAPGNASGNKGRIRARVHRGARSDHRPAVARKLGEFREPTACLQCGAVFLRKKWHRLQDVTRKVVLRADWRRCPACRQVARRVAFGRVVLRGAYVADHEAEILRRVHNCARRAMFTQPERRVVDVRRVGEELEILTTSQKLAHRIVRELSKAFHGRGRYAWMDREGALFATWEHEEGERR